VIFFASQDACFCMLMTCWVAIMVLELINKFTPGPFAIKLVWPRLL
jgi:hypothetical protein